jgi:CRISPR/Cas system Type II protein with McrA/HNH and RuvC-like nuclease domain
LFELLNKQRYKCALSGQELTPENVSLDHVVPLCDGGSDDIENVQLVTLEINRMKSTLPNSRFVELCQHVARTSKQ